MRKHAFRLVVLSTIFAVACGHGGSPSSPSSGSSDAGASGSSSGATISGVVTGPVTTVSVTSGTGRLSSLTSGTTLTPTAPLAAGLSVSVNASGQFALNGVPAGDIQLQFTGPGSDARLPIAGVTSREDIRITVRVSGGSAEAENTRRETSDHRAEIEGRVTQVNVPGRTLTIGTTVVSVPIGTPITNHGGGSIDLGAILVGDKVEAKGAMNGATFVASSVKLETEHGSGSGSGTGSGGTVEIGGTVTGRSGTCPTISFMLGTTPVTTTKDTVFEDGGCSKVVNTAKVEVKGTRGTTGVVTATRVEVDGDEDDDNEDNHNEAELNGMLTLKSGTCPSITFKVGNVSVGTTGSTEFKNVTCAMLANTDQVEVEGTRRADGSVLAKKVEKKK